MKKINKLLTTALACGVLGAGLLAPALSQGKEVKSVAATDPDPIHTEITMNEDFFENWNTASDFDFGDSGKTVPGQFKNENGKDYGGRPLNSFGSVFDGCQDGYEKIKGTLRSVKWRQNTQWIYFTWGCANDGPKGAGEQVKLVIKLWANKTDAEPTYVHDYWNDTFSKCTMVLRNYHVDDTEYAALNGDFYMSIDFVDERTGDYGAHEFGYLHVNQTHQQVSDAQWYYIQNCKDGETGVGALRNHYRTNGILRNGFVFETGFAESFDTQASFDANWVKDVYGNDNGERHPDRVISNSTYRTGGANLPFNNTNGFFKGWYGGGNDDYADHDFGYVADDWAIYRFVSRPFRLPENGIVSVKMAGNAASLHLLDFESTSDLAWVDCRTFITGGDGGLVAKGEINSCTLVNHVINFSKYGGRLVQIGIADVADGDNNKRAGGWQTAYFDELKADYTAQTVPTSFGVEVVEQNNGSISYAVLPDYYVKATEGDGGVDYAADDGPSTDASPLYGGVAWRSYLVNVRGLQEGRNYCSILESQGVKDMLNIYRTLSDDAKAVVWASPDYERVGSGDYWTINPTFYESTDSFNIRRSIEYLASVNKISISSNSALVAFLGTQTQGTIITVIIAAATVTALAFGLLMLRKKRKQK